MTDELKIRVDRIDITINGDPMNPDNPGLKADMQNIKFEQRRTNEILTEVRDSLGRINWMIVAGFVTALLATVYKGFIVTVR